MFLPNSDLYHEQLLEEAKSPRNQHEIDQPDAVAKSLNSSCGDSVSVSVKFAKDQNTIEAVSWSGAGCIISQASMSVLSDMIKGKSKDSLDNITPEMVMQELGVKSISPGRMKCLTLGLAAIKQL